MAVGEALLILFALVFIIVGERYSATVKPPEGASGGLDQLV